MKIEYDKSVDTKYITFKRGKIAKTEPIEDWLIVDYASDESVIGIEILDASEHEIGVSAVGNEFIGYFETKSLGKDIPRLEIAQEKFGYKPELVEAN
ncbi:DUF2283 domain-containing protein [Patescibacteria group bacterium]|nr:DUF2283 domain-containing protein [Patescibacteria group bacterium]